MSSTAFPSRPQRRTVLRGLLAGAAVETTSACSSSNPTGTLLAATTGMRTLLKTLRKDGTPQAALPGLPGFDEFTELVGLPEVREMEHRYR
ncbi:hypothetical protein ACFRNJ_24890 [Streptomyces sp. NPDC056721]|uniref:hypothetical protein n=1 Tax=Streptomyces sp. NPDC056721 TaxID=3345923 RepID=UPI00369E477E